MPDEAKREEMMGNAIFYDLGKQEGDNVIYSLAEWKQLISTYDVLEADNSELQTRYQDQCARTNELNCKIIDLEDRLRAALMKPQWDRKQK